MRSFGSKDTGFGVKRVITTEPTLVIGSPPCTAFSRIQQLNLHVHGGAWRLKFEKDKEKAVLRIAFCLKLFKLQRSRGAYSLMEHPAYADSWKLDCVEDFRKSEGVMTSVADQCMYGLVTLGPLPPDKEPMAAKKPTQSMSNSCCVLHELTTM